MANSPGYRSQAAAGQEGTLRRQITELERQLAERSKQAEEIAKDRDGLRGQLTQMANAIDELRIELIRARNVPQPIANSVVEEYYIAAKAGDYKAPDGESVHYEAGEEVPGAVGWSGLEDWVRFGRLIKKMRAVPLVPAGV